MDKFDVAIVGAGPSGIFTAKSLAKAGKKVVLLEQTDQVGGRIASKNLGGHIFNFAVNSFHSTAEELNEMMEHGVESETLIRDGVEISAKSSITDWANALVKGLDVRLGHKVERIEPGDNENILHIAGKKQLAAKDVILSAPAPQDMELLNNSGIKAPELEKARYSSAIFYLVALERELDELAEFHVLHHVHDTNSGDKHFYLLRFNEDWSEKPGEELREEFDEVFRPLESHVQKWKYAKVQKQISSDFQMALKAKSIYLTGDYFYGDNMDSSVLSAQGVLDEVFHLD